MHNEELYNLYTSANIIRVIKSRMIQGERHVAHIGEMRNVCKIMVGRPRHRWENL